MGGLVWRYLMASFVLIANLAPVGGQPEATKSVWKYALHVTSFLNRNQKIKKSGRGGYPSTCSNDLTPGGAGRRLA